jgi:parallel beta-helix repeat protein
MSTTSKNCLYQKVNSMAWFCRLKRWMGLLFFSFAVSALSSASTYYLDAINGSDATGTGTSVKPFKTFAKALGTVVSGDTVLMNNGSYGAIEAGRTPGQPWEMTAFDLFSNWVVFKAAPGQTPHATSISLGSLNYINSSGTRVKLDIGPTHPQGNANCYLRFEGITVDDGIDIEGSKYVYIKNCIVNRAGALNGSVGNIDNKAGITAFYGNHITLEGNDVTHCAIGIGVAGFDTMIRDNNIHHNSHDGIRVYGGTGFLIEGNRIHDLDDGADDGSGDVNDPTWDPVAGQAWNRHVDGIQIFDLNRDGSDAVVNLTIRRNLFYHLESMGMMLQCFTDGIADADLVAPGRFSNLV